MYTIGEVDRSTAIWELFYITFWSEYKDRYRTGLSLDSIKIFPRSDMLKVLLTELIDPVSIELIGSLFVAKMCS